MNYLILNTLLKATLASICVSTVLTACGGGGPIDDIASSDITKKASIAVASPVPVARVPDTFGNFNPSIWNDHNWYECNCARNPDTSLAALPWKVES